MITLSPCPDLSSIREMKDEYRRGLLAPIDGMWDAGFTDPSPHWEMSVKDRPAGYYAANDEGTLLQFHVCRSFEAHARRLFDHVVGQEELKRAVASTADPTFLSFCLDVQKGVSVHTYLYERHEQVAPSHPDEAALEFRLVDGPELERAVACQVSCLGDNSDLSDWLRGYSGNLIGRKELFVLCRNDEWLGLGEYRRSDSQPGIVDVGMMVHPSQRGKGWATYILSRLGVVCSEHGERPICSTTVENRAAQRAIERAGFVSRHCMMNVELWSDETSDRGR